MTLNKLLVPTTFAAFVIGFVATSCTEEEQEIGYSPAIVAPAPGASSESLEVTLRWEDTNTVGRGHEFYTFDVYFGTSENNLQLLASDLLIEEFKCSTLDLNTHYFWKVIARDEVSKEIAESAVGRENSLAQNFFHVVSNLSCITSINVHKIVAVLI